MLKDTLLHMLFIGAVVFAASFLKKDTAANVSDAVAQQYEVVKDNNTYPYTPLSDTLLVKRK